MSFTAWTLVGGGEVADEKEVTGDDGKIKVYRRVIKTKNYERFATLAGYSFVSDVSITGTGGVERCTAHNYTIDTHATCVTETKILEAVDNWRYQYTYDPETGV